MRKLIRVILSIFSFALALAFQASVAFAAPTLDPAVLAQARAATLVIEDSVSYCTIFPVTPDGYALTALHCVRSCLSAQGKAEDAANTYIGLQDLFAVLTPHAVNTTCQARIASLGVTSVTVVATSPGLSLFDSRFLFTFASLFSELQSAGLESRANDLALIKIQVARPLACLKIAAAAPSAGQSIVALGYPLPPQGQPVAFAQAAGTVYGSPRESRYHQTQTTSENRAWAEQIYSSPGVIYANASTTYGFSGGPIVNLDGSVVGVISGFTMTNANTPSEVHELVGGSIARFLGLLPPALEASVQAGSAGCR